MVFFKCIHFCAKLIFSFIDVINGHYAHKRRIRKNVIQDKRCWENFETSRDFDMNYGVDTEQKVSLSNLSLKWTHKILGADYQRSTPGLVKYILIRLNIAYSDYIFIDIGCGKGMPLLVACGFGFKKVIGIDVSIELCEIARNNIRLFQHNRNACHNATVICINAVDFNFPDSPLVLFMFNPFRESVLRNLLHKLMESYHCRPREMIVIYLHSVYEGVFPEIPSFDKIMDDAQFSIYRLEKNIVVPS